MNRLLLSTNGYYCQIDRSIPQWGDAPVWNELHMSTDFPTYWD